MIQLRLTFALGALLGSLALAQESAPLPRHSGGDFEYMHARMGMQKTVKGAPYSAQSVSQFTQTLADGSHIQRSTTSKAVCGARNPSAPSERWPAPRHRPRQSLFTIRWGAPAMCSILQAKPPAYRSREASR